jgi:DNA-damage-inducible protein D
MSDQQQPASGHVSPFESIRRSDEDGHEYWSARDLSKVLGYTEWRNFKTAIEKAQVACANSNHEPSDHFVASNNMIETGKGAHREVEDVRLSRYACYLIVQNADPSKEIVALGQTYFAVQTRRAEMIEDELDGLTEDQKRLFVRAQLTEHNRLLATAASDAGVITSRDFAIFQDHGYMGLYGGLKAKDIHTRKELKKGQQILDHMGSTELAANLFRATQTEEKLRRENIQGRTEANQTHFDVGRKVRQTIEVLGGTMPEELPTPPKSVQQLQREERQRATRQLQPSLFDQDEDDE